MKKLNWRLIVFLLLGAGMLLIASEKIIRAEIALRKGTSFQCRIDGYDPADPFRGRYLQFNMPDTVSGKNSEKIPRDSLCFVQLGTDKDGLAVFEKASAVRPETGDYLQVRSQRWWNGDNLRFVPPFYRYYVNERQAREAERIMQRAQAKNDCFLQFKVYKGFAVIEDILIGGQSLNGLLNP